MPTAIIELLFSHFLDSAFLWNLCEKLASFVESWEFLKTWILA
ncbi:hypothetical protein [Helicobacter sp. 16-1353]|nr:hypothetical protein [Helicobacter sp. 16-1353]